MRCDAWFFSPALFLGVGLLDFPHDVTPAFSVFTAEGDGNWLVLVSNQ
jgi:hypothetical protein